MKDFVFKNLFSNMLLLFLITLLVSAINCGPEELEGVKYADKCEGLFLF